MSMCCRFQVEHVVDDLDPDATSSKYRRNALMMEKLLAGKSVVSRSPVLSSIEEGNTITSITQIAAVTSHVTGTSHSTGTSHVTGTSHNTDTENHGDEDGDEDREDTDHRNDSMTGPPVNGKDGRQTKELQEWYRYVS
jgi:hypothetical protein